LGCPVSAYNDAAARLIAKAGEGPVIDYGCGSLVFTKDVYRPVQDRTLLFDRSLGMLQRAKKRLPGGIFLQGDALNPPFENAMFAAGMGWGMLHLFGSGSPYLQALSNILRPGAPAAISCLVKSKRAAGNRMLQLLYDKGEAALPESADSVTDAFSSIFDLENSRLIGNMLFLSGRKKNT
jgi:ubiquinone/menaquinone biosynthesis C-methylase UbiE